MEPADIDWKREVSHFVRDEAFENINAPKWVDLTDPDASFPVDDDAWFCRPDCNHPKTLEDFQRLSTPSPQRKGKITRSSSEKLPFGERNCDLRENNNLKRRGRIGTLLPSSSPFRSPIKSKKQREDTENQDPNLPRPTGVPKGGKNWKDPVKCSAKKNNYPNGENEELLCEQEKRQQQPRLRSTLSARNLFSGRDILGQISEFYNEIKRMAVGPREVSQVVEESPIEDFHENRPVDERPSKFASGSEKKKRSMKKDLRVETGKGEKGILSEKTTAVLREVRASPPTPQRFPSPSAQRLMHTKLSSAMSPTTGTGSPLKKPPKSTPERRILRDIMKQSTEDQKLLLSKDENCTEPSSAFQNGGNPTGMFWFLKPCTYLVE